MFWYVRLIVLASVSVGIAAISESPTQTVSAKIKGVPAVNLRAEPDTQSRAVAWLIEGTTVEVEAVDDNGWAKVRSARGDVGYVRRGYLALSEATPAQLRSSPAATQEVTPQRTPTDIPEVGTGAGQTDRSAEPRPQNVAPAMEIAAVDEIRRDLRTLLVQTRAIEQKLASNPSADGPTIAVQASPAFPWALLAFGVLIGALFGAAIGRRQERRRRTRIRI